MAEATAEYKVIGTRPVRPDGADKVTGRAIYGADVRMTGMLHGKVLTWDENAEIFDSIYAEKHGGPKADVEPGNGPVFTDLRGALAPESERSRRQARRAANKADRRRARKAKRRK